MGAYFCAIHLKRWWESLYSGSSATKNVTINYTFHSNKKGVYSYQKFLQFFYFCHYYHHLLLITYLVCFYAKGESILTSYGVIFYFFFRICISCTTMSEHYVAIPSRYQRYMHIKAPLFRWWLLLSLHSKHMICVWFINHHLTSQCALFTSITQYKLLTDYDNHSDVLSVIRESYLVSTFGRI